MTHDRQYIQTKEINILRADLRLVEGCTFGFAFSSELNSEKEGPYQDPLQYQP